jgi:hypothetical protein
LLRRNRLHGPDEIRVQQDHWSPNLGLKTTINQVYVAIFVLETRSDLKEALFDALYATEEVPA